MPLSLRLQKVSPLAEQLRPAAFNLQEQSRLAGHNESACTAERRHVGRTDRHIKNDTAPEQFHFRCSVDVAARPLLLHGHQGNGPFVISRSELEIQKSVDEFFVLNPERSKRFTTLVIGQEIAIIDDRLNVIENDRLALAVRNLVRKSGGTE